MPSKVTNDVLNAHRHCRLKAYFRLCGEAGVQCDFETLVVDQRRELRAQAIAKIRRRYGEGEVATDTPLSVAALRQGIPFILDGRIEDDRYSVRFDGLKRVKGESVIGDFHYEPVMFSEARRAREPDRHLLAAFAVLLSRIQGAIPTNSVLCLGPDCAMTSIRFGANLRAAEDTLRDAERMQRADTPPKLRLNEHCGICEFRDRCRARAIQEDNLSLLRGLSDRAIKRYARKGLLTLTQLAHTFRPRRRGKRSNQPPKLRDHALQALAIRDKTIYVLGKPELPVRPVCMHLDIEGSLDQDFIYLIGVVVSDGERLDSYSFWANDKEQETSIFDQFLELVGRYDTPRIYCYGNYEKTFIVRMRRHSKRKKPTDAILDALTNVLKVIYPHFYFPTYSNGLKDIGRCLGCDWSEPNSSSIQSVAWRMHWERTGDECWKTKLIRYNLEDCKALRRVTEFLKDSCLGGSKPQLGTIPRVAPVTELDALARTVNWSKFTDANFEFVNKCAYFDYQRTHVFARTNAIKRRRKRSTLKRTWGNRKIRATHRVKVTASKCPFCSSRNIIPERQRSKGLQTRCKRAFDVVVRPGTIKRKVIDFRAVAYRCSECERSFVSERYHRLARYFHGFMSWSTYQQITHRLGIKSLVRLFQETLGIQVSPSEFLAFRNLLARYYGKTYKKLLADIIAGPVIHIDETEVRLTQRTGYVWVFANAEAAVYMFRPSREGEFLRKLVRGSGGVLVSDFYSAYDGLDCLQQRCLIHLMRDMNRAILDNPFDQELQSITTPFGELLRSIVETIDEHGLRRRYLERHSKAAENFLEALRVQVHECEASKALQERLIRNSNRLFTFLRHDGVSWNNNLAENAIKRVSDLREDVGRSMKEAGLAEHLVLLSLYQTCRVRGISFLKFLLSRERDMDTFCGGERRRRHTTRIELYPKGYLPPSLISLRRGKRLTVPATLPACTDEFIE